MLNLSGNTRIFLRREPTDMRLGYNGLSALAEKVFSQNPTSGHLFVFVNRQKNRAKMLLWERGGFWLIARRLEQGTFALPAPSEDGSLVLDHVAWVLFLEGAKAERIQRQKRYFPLA